MSLVLFFLIVYIVMSGATLLAFTIDKMAAQQGKRRIPERVLHTLELAFGWPGALIALNLVKHKRQKESYTRVLYSICVLHFISFIFIVIWWYKT